jgi:aryl-alcohol dehydrogenase-like predicted oxidoreductase
VIATKGGLERPGPDRWTANGHPNHLRQACEGSLRRLRLDRIDLYQLHTPDRRVPIEESVGALVLLQQQGKIRYIGLSNVDSRELARAQRVARIVSVQNKYSLGGREDEDMVDLCTAHKLVYIPWFPLGSGALARSGGRLARAAARYEATPAQLALAWLLHRSPVMLAIPGTSSVKHLEENVRAAAIRLDKSDIGTLQ